MKYPVNLKTTDYIFKEPTIFHGVIFYRTMKSILDSPNWKRQLKALDRLRHKRDRD